MKQEGYIYRVTNRANGWVYVGQKRGEFNRNYLGSGVRIKKAVREFGEDLFNLEFIQSAFSQRDLDILEKHFISDAKKNGPVYNISSGGQGAYFTERFSSVGSNNGMFGKKHSQETRAKIAAKRLGVSVNKGVKRPPEQIERMRQVALRNKPWLMHVGRKRSEETKKRLSDAAKARWANGYKLIISQDGRKRISDAKKKFWADKKRELLPCA